VPICAARCRCVEAASLEAGILVGIMPIGAVFLIPVLVLTGTALSHADVLPRIRTCDASITRALAEGRDASPTFRRLVAEIERSDLILHVRMAGADARADGAFHFVTTAGGSRFVRISLRRGLPREVMVALLGHELMHAVEVARHPDVRDERSMRALYERIGHAHEDGQFDTDGAVQAGAGVRRELRAFALQPLHRRSSAHE
jgi:hypothetical protein